ncbi:MAG: rhomboid family intramembrane serine protease [Spirochaetes bacterium]|nr:rhomboid family intramembrane serine protease [Spirochaetota bacterium]
MLRQNVNFRFGGPITEIVKKLLIINAGIFVLQHIFNLFFAGTAERIFGLNHVGFIYEFKIWQPVTYMFLHGNLLHLFFNLFALWMFGGELEQRWGKKVFLKYYIFCGIGAGLFIAFMNFIVFAQYGYAPITIGASGAIYGILLAYGMIWPNREVLLYFLFPVKIKYLVIGFGIIEFLGTISSAAGAGGTISHIGHLGGLFSGFVFIIYKRKKSRLKNKNEASTGGKVSQFLMQERLKRKQQEIDKRIQAKNIIDSLLEKIAKEGMGSLTHKEKSDLEWARKHYYPDDEDIVH